VYYKHYFTLLSIRNALGQRLTCGPRTSGGPRLFKKLNNFSLQINKVLRKKTKYFTENFRTLCKSEGIWNWRLQIKFVPLALFVGAAQAPSVCELNKIFRNLCICLLGIVCVFFVYCFAVQIVEMAQGSAASSSDSVGVRRSQKVKNRCPRLLWAGLGTQPLFTLLLLKIEIRISRKKIIWGTQPGRKLGLHEWCFHS
jgi:hypothetical protein